MEDVDPEMGKRSIDLGRSGGVHVGKHQAEESVLGNAAVAVVSVASSDFSKDGKVGIGEIHRDGVLVAGLLGGAGGGRASVPITRGLAWGAHRCVVVSAADEAALEAAARRAHLAAAASACVLEDGIARRQRGDIDIRDGVIGAHEGAAVVDTAAHMQHSLSSCTAC